MNENDEDFAALMMIGFGGGFLIGPDSKIEATLGVCSVS
jgi:hypothetical protein